MRKLRFREKSYPWGLFTFFLAVYLLYPTNLPYIDGLYFAYHVENMPLHDTFHPHHLLFLTITQVLYSFAHSIFENLRGLQFYQIVNSILAAITLVYFYNLLLALYKRPLAAFLGTFFMGASFGFWHHATDANIYISFNLVLTILLSRYLTDREFTKASHIITTALITAFATMLHQLGIFLLIPIGAALLAKSENNKPNLKALYKFLAVYITAVAIPYLLVFFLAIAEGKPSVALFAKWVTAYGSNKSFWPILYHDIYYCVGMVSRSQFESFFHILPAQIILYRGSETGEGASLVNLFSFVLALILMLIIERIHFINFRANPDEKSLYRKVLWWMIPFFVFFWFFAPENYFYRIFYLAPLIIFGAGLINSSTMRDKKNIKPFLFVFVVFTFLYNAIDGIIPESRMSSNPYIRNSALIDESISSDDLVIFASNERYLASTFRYYRNRECLHALHKTRFRTINKDELEKAKLETTEFLRGKYSGIYLSAIAREMGVDAYFFSSNNFPMPHPDIMVIDKDQAIQIGDILTQTGTYFKIRLSDPHSVSSKDEDVILIYEVPETMLPVR
jgi:hypothetical protein